MHILIISTPGDKVREENVKKQFEYQTDKHPYELVPAIMNPGQPPVGVSRSFKKCIQLAKDGEYPSVLILEDDFDCMYSNAISDLIKLWYEMWSGSILLGGIYEGEVADSKHTEIAKVNGKLSGLHAMIIGEELYDKLLQAEEPYNLDYWISMEAKIPIFVMYPMGIMQLDGIHSYNANQVTNYGAELHHKYKIVGK